VATGGVGAAAWKKESCIDPSASARGVEDEEPSVEGLAPGAGSGALPTIEFRFGLGSGATLFVRVVSSKGLHLKSFLYPPHVTLRLWHC
jgi:hypothetical protein